MHCWTQTSSTPSQQLNPPSLTAHQTCLPSYRQRSAFCAPAHQLYTPGSEQCCMCRASNSSGNSPGHGRHWAPVPGSLDGQELRLAGSAARLHAPGSHGGDLGCSRRDVGVRHEGMLASCTSAVQDVGSRVESEVCAPSKTGHEPQKVNQARAVALCSMEAGFEAGAEAC